MEGLTPDQVESAFWRKIEADEKPCLWIVDDLPSGLATEEIQTRWNAQWSRASTLITTRSFEYAFGRPLDLDVLTESESLQLLTARRSPQGSAEEEAAKRIAAELGHHPLAIEVAGSFLAKGTQTFQQYLEELGNPDQDAVEFGATLRESLPTGHERSISGTLMKSIRLLGEEGLDFLRLASVLAVDAIPVRLVAAVFERLEAQAPNDGRVLGALDQADSLGLCTMVGDDARRVHALVSRTIRYRTVNDGRVEAVRVAAVWALSAALEVVGDIRRHGEVAREVVHARHLLSERIGSVEDADLALWVGRQDYERGDYSGAQRLWERVLEVRQQSVGAEHPDTLASVNNLASLYASQGRYGEAEPLYVRRAGGARAGAGGRASGHADARSTTSPDSTKSGAVWGSRAAVCPRAGGAAERVLGAEHPDTLVGQTTSPDSTQVRGGMGKPSRCMSARWRRASGCWGPSIRTR